MPNTYILEKCKVNRLLEIHVAIAPSSCRFCTFARIWKRCIFE